VLLEGMSHLKRKMTVMCLDQGTQHTPNGSSALRVKNEPTTVSPDLATYMLAAIATLVTVMSI
jgi:hypothetical protein